MKKRYGILALCLVLSAMLCACTTQPRRTVPQTPGGDTNQQQQLQQQGQPGQMRNTTPDISATYQKADVDYIITTRDVAVKGGTSNASPTITTLKSGTKVRVVAKYGDWYVAYLPDNRVGMIPATNTKLNTPTAASPVPDVAGSTGNSLATEESQMINLINQERSSQGLKPISANMDLTKLARLKSKDIADKGYFSHNSPTYGSPFEMMRNNGISYMYAGENLAKNSSVQAAHQALMNSTDHRKNILNPNFTEVGIGVIGAQGDMKIYTQMFIGR